MKHVRTGTRAFFKVIATSGAAQAAMMTLAPGKTTGTYANEHPRCEQWLYVVSGTGRARVGERRVPIHQGSLLLIDKDEHHQIRCTGREPLVALNVYVPPAYAPDGDVLPSAS